MHVYQSQKKKKMNVFWTAIIAGMSMLVLFFLYQPQILKNISREAEMFCYEKMLKLYMPNLMWEEYQTKTIAQIAVEHFFPLATQGGIGKTYETQVESELSYEMILAWEAADENYVDEETGEVVMQEETAKSQEKEAQEAPTQEENVTDVQQTATVEQGKVVTYPREKLNDFDFLIQNFYQIDNTTTIDGSQLNAEALLGKDMSLSHDASTPQILIYHTHSQEAYADSIAGDLNTSVVGVADYLTNLLTQQYGLNVIHHRGTYDVGDRDHAYSKAGPALEQILAENPSIEVVIDLHRDGVREDTHLVTEINGKQTAQIMFFNGLSRTTKTGDIDYLYNPNIADNLAASFQMQLAAAEYYPDFTRRIYLKGYRYNMHYCPKTLLIEVGAQTNTFGEALNAMEPLADILNKVLTGTE